MRIGGRPPPRTMVSNGLTVPAGTRVIRPRGPVQTAAAGPWAPPPLPTGSYDPTRDIGVEESQRGLGQLEDQNSTSRQRASSDYATNVSEIGRRGQQRTADYQRAKDMLTQSFQRLAGSQEEGANQAGVLQGGAMLQAAAKRAANQAQQQGVADTGYQRGQQGDTLELAKLARENAPPDASNPLGGRTFQDLLTQLTNAQGNNAFYAESQQRLKGQEAAERGYTPPTAPSSAIVRAAARPWKAGPRGTAVRIGGR